ncbi:MAG TPA: hypothetical protein VN903_28630 [Polyangia bacterium]|nr:hypothetical protein [Polyangia bacterium]
MSIRAIEELILFAVRELLENRKLRFKDLYEWKSGPINDARPDELVVEVDANSMHWWVAVPKAADMRGLPPGTRGRGWPPKLAPAEKETPR